MELDWSTIAYGTQQPYYRREQAKPNQTFSQQRNSLQLQQSQLLSLYKLTVHKTNFYINMINTLVSLIHFLMPDRETLHQIQILILSLSTLLQMQ